jgi:hypothetical protein
MPDIPAAVEKIKQRLVETVCTKYAVEAEQMAKDNAPWTDRTHDARKLLKGVVLDGKTTVDTKLGSVTIGKEKSIGIALVHRVEYGKYLETANSGQYAILKPTIEALRSSFLGAVRQALGGK